LETKKAVVAELKVHLEVNKNTNRQKKLFGDMPTIEEAVKRYCTDKDLIL
jgi:hypothetical protein